MLFLLGTDCLCLAFCVVFVCWNFAEQVESLSRALKRGLVGGGGGAQRLERFELLEGTRLEIVQLMVPYCHI